MVKIIKPTDPRIDVKPLVLRDLKPTKKTLRDEFAMAALIAILPSADKRRVNELSMPIRAYQIADAMLAARGEDKPKHPAFKIKDTDLVEVTYRNGIVARNLCGKIDWSNPEIAAYRVVDKGWIKWNGGKRPVFSDTRVEIELRDGTMDRNMAGVFRWEHDEANDDIIAYRVVERV